jgi:hypothetical protein
MKDGLLHIPRCRGVGLEWNEEMVEATLRSFWQLLADIVAKVFLHW